MSEGKPTDVKVGDVIEGPQCAETGCSGRLVKKAVEVTDKRIVWDLSCTHCGEQAFDESFKPRGNVRVIVALMLHHLGAGRDDDEVVVTDEEMQNALNFNFRVGRRSDGRRIYRLSWRRHPFQPSED